MFERIVSRPVQTAFVAVEIEVSWALSERTTSSCSRMAVSAAAIAAASTSTSCSTSDASASSRARRIGGLERGRLGGLGIDDAVDVVADEVERRDARRGMGRREDDDRDGRAAVLPRLAQLVAHRPHRHRAVLRLDHDPHVAAARDPRVEGQHEVALLRLHEGAGLGAGPVEQVAGAAGEVGEHRLEQVLEVAALGRRPGAFGAAGGGGRLDRDQALLERRKPAVISWRNWCIGELRRVGSSSSASLEASPSK